MLNVDSGEKTRKEITIAGFLVGNDREKVGLKAPHKLAEFDTKVGYKKYAPMNFYPLQDALCYQTEAVKSIFSKDLPEGYYQFGKMDFETIMTSHFGKVIGALFFKDFKSGLLSGPKFLEKVVKGVMWRVEERSDHEIAIILDSNKLFPREYWQGLLEAYLNYFKINGQVIINDYQADKRVITVRW